MVDSIFVHRAQKAVGRSLRGGSLAAALTLFIFPSANVLGSEEPAHGAGVLDMGSSSSAAVLPPVTAPTDAFVAQLDLLPQKATARFPVHSGDPFFVHLEPVAGPAPGIDQLAEEVVEPILQALGFEPGVEGLQWPQEPVQTSALDMAGMMEDVAAEVLGASKESNEINLYLLEVLRGAKEGGERADAALGAALGMSLEEIRAEFEAPRFEYLFLQTINGVPIEHAGVFVEHRDGWTVDSIHGSLYGLHRVVNSVNLGPIGVKEVVDALRQGEFDPAFEVEDLHGESALVLLPYGTGADGVAELRHSWRVTPRVRWGGEEGLALLYVDAEDGSLLAFRPWLGHAVEAQGKVFHRAPDVGAVTAKFGVDAAQGGEYVLQDLPDIFRVDRWADGQFPDEVAISDSTAGSSSTFANFDQFPLNDPTDIECNVPGPNRGFEEVNLFQTLHRNRQLALAFGIWQPFPASPWQPRMVDNTSFAVCNAFSSMLFGACQGFAKSNCPNFSGALINHAHDRTVISHEVAHSAVPRLTEARPTNWCGSGPCPLPKGWDPFHDLADFWADHMENTNCTGGWVAKNWLWGANGSLNCSPNSDEGGLLPRLHELATPFDPLDPSDHFPEHGQLASGGYAYGQVAAAALWETRVGMRSRNLVAGHTLFWYYFQRSLRQAGFLNFSAPVGSQRQLFEQLYELEVQMMQSWTFNAMIGSTSNKLQSGFARAGLFLIPPVCLDNNPNTADARYCPNGENGGAAVIDIDDNVPADDLVLNDVLHRETDYLELGGVAPSFDVWTGPRWQFNGNSALPVTQPPKCNNRFWVEVSLDPQFPFGQSLNSFWVTVDTDVTTTSSPECYGRWTPSQSAWDAFTSSTVPGSRIYYRVFTIDATGGNLMSSDQPGKALWRTLSPYAVMTDDGRFATFRAALGISNGGNNGGIGGTN